MEPQLVSLENGVFQLCEIDTRNNLGGLLYSGKLILPKYLRQVDKPQVLTDRDNVIVGMDPEGAFPPSHTQFRSSLEYSLTRVSTHAKSFQATHYSLDRFQLRSSPPNFVTANITAFGIFTPYRLETIGEQLELKLK